jgi:hypothetical protein
MKSVLIPRHPTRRFQAILLAFRFLKPEQDPSNRNDPNQGPSLRVENRIWLLVRTRKIYLLIEFLLQLQQLPKLVSTRRSGRGARWR